MAVELGFKTRAWLEELRKRAGDSADLHQEFEQNCRQQAIENLTP